MGGGGHTCSSQEGLRRWVWAANQNRQIGKNSTLTFSRNGNLVLADTNGYGKLKLLTKISSRQEWKFVWQSSDYPSDTLLNGQGLIAGGPNKLVSGSYSLEVGGQLRYPTLFFKNKNNPPMIYHTFNFFCDQLLSKSKLSRCRGCMGSTRIQHNSINALARKDGKLFVYTFNLYTKTWERVFSYFLSISGECILPEKCGVFGLCKNQKCISCPSSKGLMAASWNKDCKREKIPDCKTTQSKADYYKMASVSSSIRTSNNDDYKNMSVYECKKKCSRDCQCTGFFYRKAEKTCLVATTEIYTLTSDPIRYELGYLEPEVDTYIKYAK
ncbi:hypothetical protein MKX01_001611 [Papaver californicum]|nr:hypothetical protein MKX01_001611 [Papaver californicum]